jgi:hypothetical protein
LADGHRSESCGNGDSKKTTNKGHLIVKLRFQKRDTQ